MDLRREVVTMIGALVLLNVLLAFSTVGLLARMGPAIQQILEANVYSMSAAEDALVVLAEAGDAPILPDDEAALEDALARLDDNVTEDEEAPALARIRRDLPVAVVGPGPARSAVVRELDRLMTINSGAMERADVDARRLGQAGAWASALLGIFAFTVSLLVLRRARVRLITPLVELDEVLAGVHSGQVLRRCRTREAPRELVRVAGVVNDLLDERAEHQRIGPRDLTPPLASALQGLLDERPAPTFVVDREGAILRANDAGMALLGGDQGEPLRDALHAASRGDDPIAGLDVRPLSNQLGFLCTWAPTAATTTTTAAASDMSEGTS
ncbi:MAG: hypothetical protein R3B09_10120 [Nannocystaceae bacterium]